MPQISPNPNPNPSPRAAAPRGAHPHSHHRPLCPPSPIPYTLALAALLLTACQSATTSQRPVASPRPFTSESPAAQPETPAPEHLHTDPNAVADPCADRMQDLCEAMLLYYIANKHLPASLPELQPYADAGVTLTFKCPTTGDPFVYTPPGLTAPGVRDRLLLYDASPVHQGHRWAIVMAPAQNGKPVLMYVIPLQQNLLNAYLHGK